MARLFVFFLALAASCLLVTSAAVWPNTSSTPTCPTPTTPTTPVGSGGCGGVACGDCECNCSGGGSSGFDDINNALIMLAPLIDQLNELLLGDGKGNPDPLSTLLGAL